MIAVAPLTPPVLRPSLIAFVFPGKRQLIISRHEMAQPDACDDGDEHDVIDGPDGPRDAEADGSEPAS